MSAKKNDLLFLSVVGLFWFAQYVFVPFLSPHLSAMGIAASLVGTIMGGYGLAQLLLRIPISVTEDCIGRDRVFMVCGLAAMMAAVALPLVFETATAYLLCRVLMGVGASTWVSFSISFTRGAADGQGRMARLMVANNLGILISYIVGGVVFPWLGMKALFVLAGAAAAAGLCILPFCRIESLNQPRPFAVKTFLTTLGNKHLLLCCFFGAMLQLVIFATAMSFVTNFAKTLGVSSVGLSLLSITFYVAGVGASAVCSKGIFRQLSPRCYLALGFGVLTLYCALLSVCRGVWSIALVQLLGGAGRAMLYTYLMASNPTQVVATQKTTAMGIFQSLYSIGMTLGPVVMGALLDTTGMNYATSFLAIGAVALCGVGLSLVMWRKKA